MITLYFVIPPNLCLLDLAGAADAFRMANNELLARGKPAAFALCFVAADIKQVSSSLGLGFTGVKKLPQSLATHSWIILNGSSSEASVLDDSDGREIVQWLRRVAPAAEKIVCICTGALMAAAAGLLAGKRCTTHHALTSELARIEPNADVLENRIFVADGSVYTSAGITSGIDLALHLISEVTQPAIAASVARSMVVFTRRGADGVQLSPWLTSRNHLHNGVHRVQDLVGSDPTQNWPLAALAEHAHMSERNLTRAFKTMTGQTIRDYHNQLRLALAQNIAATQQLTSEQIAERVGIGSARHLRRLMQHARESNVVS